VRFFTHLVGGVDWKTGGRTGFCRNKIWKRRFFCTGLAFERFFSKLWHNCSNACSVNEIQLLFSSIGGFSSACERLDEDKYRNLVVQGCLKVCHYVTMAV